MPRYADIVFPTAVRKAFTYSVPPELQGEVRPGVRVWVPLRRRMAIGMTVRVHGDQPDFNTRPVEDALDEHPVLSDELLELTGWIHRFYYCSWGEVVQAALPAGLNFYSEKKLRLHPALEGEIPGAAGGKEEAILREICDRGGYPLEEAGRRWERKQVDRLVGRNGWRCGRSRG